MKSIPSFLPTPCSASPSSSSSTIITASKKKRNPQPSSSPQTPPPSPPPRITSNLKQNLQFLNLWKQIHLQNRTTPKPSTSYRRKKPPKQLPPPQDPPTPPTLSYSFHGLHDSIPVLLVDGYNVCGYWIKLKKHFRNGELDIARQKLIDELLTFGILREMKIVVVFDASMSGLPTRKENFYGIEVVYSSETSADCWIENEVAVLKENGCPKVWVATSDRGQQEAANGAGAFVWSCRALVCEIKAMEKEVERSFEEQNSSSFEGKLLKHNLESEVVDALKDLRTKLSKNV